MTAPTPDVPAEQDWSALFLLDVVARYAVDRCGAEDTILTALTSVACVLPIWVWVCSLVLMLVEIELYLNLARYTLTMLTIIQIVLLALFQEGFAVAGCGPSRSFPNPQTAISHMYLQSTCAISKLTPYRLPGIVGCLLSWRYSIVL